MHEHQYWVFYEELTQRDSLNTAISQFNTNTLLNIENSSGYTSIPFALNLAKQFCFPPALDIVVFAGSATIYMDPLKLILSVTLCPVYTPTFSFI